MFVIGFGIGAVLGVFSAWRRKGNVLDMLQYAAGFGIAVGIVYDRRRDQCTDEHGVNRNVLALL